MFLDSNFGELQQLFQTHPKSPLSNYGFASDGFCISILHFFAIKGAPNIAKYIGLLAPLLYIRRPLLTGLYITNSLPTCVQ